MDAVRYEDESDRVLLELATEHAPLVEAMAEIVVEEVQAEIDRSTPAGREYPRRKGSKEKRRASAPGQAPAGDIYRNSWKASEASRSGDVISASAYSKAKTKRTNELLAPMLEYGTPKMAPRPHIRPAVERARQRIERMVGDAGEVDES